MTYREYAEIVGEGVAGDVIINLRVTAVGFVSGCRWYGCDDSGLWLDNYEDATAQRERWFT